MKKKVLITAFDFPPQWGGVASYSWELANYLHSNNYEVLVVTKKRPQTIQADFKIVELKLANSGLVSFPIMSVHLFRIIKDFLPDHIISTLWLPGAAAVFLTQKLLRRSLDYSIVVHAMEIIESQETLKKRFRSKLSFIKQSCFSAAKNCFCVSRFTKELLLSTLSIDAKKVHVINNGVNPKNFNIASIEKAHDFPLILTACRLIPNKGVDEMIKAMSTIHKEFPKAHYIILGDGPDRDRLAKLIKLLNAENYITLKGKVDHKSLQEHYQKAHLFVMLSRKQKHYVEGFGLVFLEAALHKTPSLGGLSGGIPDAIEDGKTGWLVDPYHSQKIEEKLLEILKDQKTLLQMGEFAQKMTLENRTWDIQFSKMMDIIND